MRDEILSLLSGQNIDNVPVFSGLIHITAEGLQSEGLSFSEVHHDAQKMAKAAASTYRLTGMPSAALPLDLCAPAEALGAELKFHEDELRFPQVKKALFQSTKEVQAASDYVLEKGRLKIICEAISVLKNDAGSGVVISGTIPGPYTLLLYLCQPQSLFMEMKKEPDSVQQALAHLSAFLAHLAHMYHQAGADFITIHEMGGSPGFIGPAKFDQFVFPALQQLISQLSPPTVLSVCGHTNKSMQLLAQTGADAISVDQTNDLAASRQVLTDTLLFGNIDPVATLWQGDKAHITESVRRAKEAGLDAVWPGCDLVPQTSIENLKAFVAAS